MNSPSSSLGPFGNYTILTPTQEAHAAKTLGLKVELLSTQVIPRDRIAKLISITRPHRFGH